MRTQVRCLTDPVYPYTCLRKFQQPGTIQLSRGIKFSSHFFFFFFFTSFKRGAHTRAPLRLIVLLFSIIFQTERGRVVKKRKKVVRNYEFLSNFLFYTRFFVLRMTLIRNIFLYYYKITNRREYRILEIRGDCFFVKNFIIRIFCLTSIIWFD